MFQELRASLSLLVLFTLLTGIAYPLAVTTLGQSLFPHQAGGSLSVKDGTIIGSELIGQTFESDKYFHARPSAAGNGYDASNSSGSNLYPTSQDLLKTITARVEELRRDGDARPVPVDLVTTSGSGLDPDISVAGARYQASHVATERQIPIARIQELIAQNTTARSFGILGTNRVNVLALNRALDLLPATPTAPAAIEAPEPMTPPAPAEPETPSSAPNGPAVP
jgi:K+-transporting ATPase ATPase C chain